MGKINRRLETYFDKNPMYNAVVHLLAGMGLGILLVHPLLGGHTIRWGLTFLALGILGHLYPLLSKSRK